MNREEMIKEKIFNTSKAGSFSIIPQRVEEWITFCYKCYKDNKFYIANDIVFTMKLLDEGKMSYTEIENLIDYGQYSGQDWEILEMAVAKYHPSGVEFVRKNNEKVIGTTFDQYLKRIDFENKELLKVNNKKSK